MMKLRSVILEEGVIRERYQGSQRFIEGGKFLADEEEVQYLRGWEEGEG